MAVIAAHPAAVHYAATDTTGEVGGINSCEMSVNGGLIDVTAFDDTSGYHVMLQGLKDGEFTISGFYDSASSPQALIITHALAGTTGYFRWYPTGSAGWKCTTKVSDFSVGGAPDGAITFKATLKMISALTAV